MLRFHQIFWNAVELKKRHVHLHWKNKDGYKYWRPFFARWWSWIFSCKCVCVGGQSHISARTAANCSGCNLCSFKKTIQYSKPRLIRIFAHSGWNLLFSHPRNPDFSALPRSCGLKCIDWSLRKELAAFRRKTKVLTTTNERLELS